MQFSSPVDGTSDILDDDEGVPQNPGTKLDLMCVEVANLLADAKRAKLNPNNDGDGLSMSAYDLLLKAQALDAKLASWPDFVPANWIPAQVPVEDVPISVVNTGFYGESCDVYLDIMVCNTWNEWRVARLMVLGLIARINHEPSKSQAIIKIQHLVDGICTAVPFSLGDRIEPGNLYEAQVYFPSLPGRPTSKEHQKTATAYGGWYLFAPFKETMNVGMHLRSGQREWLSGQLVRLAKIYDVVPTLPR